MISSVHLSNDWRNFLKSKVITSSTERIINPWIAAIFSLAVTGLGQVYAGNPFSGIVLFLLKIISIIAIPFYSLIKSGEYLSEEITVTIFAFLLITLSAPIHAFFIVKNKKSQLLWYNSSLFYSIYTLITVTITILAILLFTTFFEIKQLPGDTPPLFRMNDIIAIKKINLKGYTHGDMVTTEADSTWVPVRVIGVPGESISCKKGRFLSDGSELPLSIFNEAELKKLALTDYDVISEINGQRRYPVRKGNSLKSSPVFLKENIYFLAPDVRESSDSFITASSGTIHGRVEGIIFSRSTGFFPGRISLPAENSLTGK